MDPSRLITTTEAVDPVFIFIFGVSLVLLLGITATMIAFVVRYHRSRAPRPTSQVASNLWLEIVWTALPTLLVLAMFYYGWSGYLALRTIPKGAMQVTATAAMWSWSFTYENGKTSPKLYVPAGQPIQVNLVSRDVIHGFYIPAFRVKRDVVPGMQNRLWFMAEKPGSYDLFCSQYCGTGHSQMTTTVEAIPPADFAAWLNQTAPVTISGRDLLQKHGCLGCHTVDGTAGVGPSFKGIWGRTETIVTEKGVEKTIIVDEPYLRRSILEPHDDIVKGFQPIMPSFSTLTEQEVTALVEALKGVK